MFSSATYPNSKCTITNPKKLDFSHPRYITTDTFLKQTLQRCTSCFELTANASLVLPEAKLPFTTLPKHTKKKFVLIVHMKSDNLLAPGHWSTLIVFPISRRCLFIDPLNDTQRNTSITMPFLHDFCSLNNLHLHNFNTKFQSNNSKLCGFLALFMTMKASACSFHQMLTLKKLIKANPIKTNEKCMLHNVLRHFRIML